MNSFPLDTFFQSLRGGGDPIVPNIERQGTVDEDYGGKGCKLNSVDEECEEDDEAEKFTVSTPGDISPASINSSPGRFPGDS